MCKSLARHSWVCVHLFSVCQKHHIIYGSQKLRVHSKMGTSSMPSYCTNSATICSKLSMHKPTWVGENGHPCLLPIMVMRSSRIMCPINTQYLMLAYAKNGQYTLINYFSEFLYTSSKMLGNIVLYHSKTSSIRAPRMTRWVMVPWGFQSKFVLYTL